MIENRPWLTIFSHTMLILGDRGDPLPAVRGVCRGDAG